MILRITFKKYGYITGLIFLSFFISGITFGMEDQKPPEAKKKRVVSLLGLPRESSPRTSPRRDEGMKGLGVSSLLAQPSPRISTRSDEGTKSSGISSLLVQSSPRPNSPHQTSSRQSSPRRSSPRPESPRRTPRSRSNSHLSTEPTSFGIQMIRALTPRKLRPNDSILEQFESMGTPKSEGKQDLRRLKFYQEFTDQKGTRCHVGKYNGRKNTTESLLNKFWDFPATEYTVTEYISADFIEKIESKQLAIIGSSAIFLINNIHEDLVSDLEALSRVVCDIYSTLLIRLKAKEGEKENRQMTNEDATKELSSQDCYYYMAKHSTLLKSYTLAWTYLGFCGDLLAWEDKEELRWLKLLRDGYVGYLKQGLIVDSPKYKVNFEAARFVQKVKDKANILANSKDTTVDDDVVDLCFEGVKDLYESKLTVEQKVDEVSKLTSRVGFSLGCTAYHAAKQEEANTEKLLTIARDCFGLLGLKMARYNFMVLADDILLGGRFKFPQVRDSRSLKGIKADILAQVGSVVWQADKDKSRKLFFEAAKILYHINPLRSCPVWDQNVLEIVLGCTMDLNPEIVSPEVWEGMVGGMSHALVYGNHPSIIYLPVLRYYMKKEMWVTAHKLAHLITKSKLMPSSHATELDALAKEIMVGYDMVQKDKKSAGKEFQDLIVFIINHKAKPNPEKDAFVNRWVEYGLMTMEQWNKFEKTDAKYLHSISSTLCAACKRSSPTFLNLEIEAYIDALKDMIGLTESSATKTVHIS